MKARLLVGVAIGAIASVLLGSAAPASKKSLAASAVETLHSDCDALPDGVTEIAGMRTAWAIRSAESSALRLQFADEMHGCREPASLQSGECLALWRFGFTLLPELQKPGVYDLSGYDVGYSDFVVETVPRTGCNAENGCSITGRGPGGPGGPVKEIEIYSVTETCITGRVLQLDRGLSSSPPDFTGGFRAAICSREP